MSEGETVAFLSNGASYGCPEETVERVETHCSVVFLVGEHAFKLKRPVAFSALDYRTVAKREEACRREVEINRRTAPDLYLGVQAIRRDERGTLSLEGSGPVVDWVVVMRRFDRTKLFDRLADRGLLTPTLMLALAEEIARLHQSAPATPSFGGSHGIRDAIERNRADQATTASVLSPELIADLHARSLSALDRVASLLDERRVSGLVRLCHGDLRLANICLYHGHPTPFDAIEFADHLSRIDVLYDLAFLLMDLEQRGLHGHAQSVIEHYMETTQDRAGLPALPLLISVRAGTRAYAVAASSLRRADPHEAAALAKSARDLMALALSLLDERSSRWVSFGAAAAAPGSADPSPRRQEAGETQHKRG